MRIPHVTYQYIFVEKVQMVYKVENAMLSTDIYYMAELLFCTIDGQKLDTTNITQTNTRYDKP